MANQNLQKTRDGSNRGGRRNSGEGNNARSHRSFAEVIAGFWPLALLPALVVTFALWHFFVVRDGLPWNVAALAGIATAFVLNSLLTIWFYKEDKRLAEQQLRRIPEFCLHFWELFCGWPGALYAQKKYHHKWKKTSYMVVFWLYVVLNVLAVGCLVCPDAMRSVVEESLDSVLRLLNARN